MTTCSICYEEFNDGNDEETAGSDLDIGISLKCETLKCDSLICNGCQIKLQKQIGRNNVIKCPFCRQIQFKNHFTWNVLQEDLYLWKEKRKRKLSLGIYCNEELINGLKSMIEITNKQLEEFKNLPPMVEATHKTLEDFTKQMEKIQREMNEKIEKLAIYD
tara:strand:+ start:1481 stop:1963 length:483 start_codon:yes stop_codon:yes gene_type:complete